MKTFHLFIITLLLSACSQAPGPADPAALKQEVTDTELAFARMAADSGISAAFRAYAAPDAVMRRGKGLVKGRDSIAAYISASYNPGETLIWAPEFVDVAASGELAYTYGKFTYSFADSSGTIQKQTGYFHTVWKRQADGSWKFVWD